MTAAFVLATIFAVLTLLFYIGCNTYGKGTSETIIEYFLAGIICMCCLVASAICVLIGVVMYFVH